MLSVLINHYRSPAALKLCLQSAQQSLRDIEHEIIVSDSAAERATERMVAHDFPEVRYLPFQRNVGFAKLVNAAIKQARGEFLFILNADNVIILKTVETLIEYLRGHPDVGMVGPRLEYQNGAHQPSAFRFYTPLIIVARRTFIGNMQFGKRALGRFMLCDILREPIATMNPLTVDWLMGSAILVRREAAEAVGPFDEHFFLYFEDVDWCRRFWEKGWKVVWFPQVRIVHVHGQASKSRNPFFDVFLNPYARIHFFSAIKYFKKYGLKTPHYGI